MAGYAPPLPAALLALLAPLCAAQRQQQPPQSHETILIKAKRRGSGRRAHHRPQQRYRVAGVDRQSYARTVAGAPTPADYDEQLVKESIAYRAIRATVSAQISLNNGFTADLPRFATWRQRVRCMRMST
jgi:hypothetical protein